ncbi:hypothetical protein FACS1894185_5480 [Betaproteobacteria bacterium]|nr:hypothetical protein FACS1894185_5480 [Betaproteobacteria bacterium]GHU14102.1 hypothetical protein FACS189441_3000 [Betaproteobacteria bacterium]
MITNNMQPDTTAEEKSGDDLINRELPDGWVVNRAITRPIDEDLTGGHFSRGYIASKTGKNGKITDAFLKVIDVAAALRSSSGSLMERLKVMTDSHTFECTILNICTHAKMDRIVKVLGRGELLSPPNKNLQFSIPIPYILFELADGDIRKVVSRTDKLDDAWRFRILHDAAVGLQQLHSQDIAHQDLKPSNVLIYNKDKAAKLGDLGRASRKGLPANHDNIDVAGDLSYAPPEQLYGKILPEWVDRREGCDLYHLGNLAMFLFTGTTPSAHYRKDIVEILPRAWGGQGNCDYSTALPALIKSFTKLVDKIKDDLPEWSKDEMTLIIKNACNPDYTLRGDPDARKRVGSPIGIETFVSRFDRLSKRAMVEIKK